MNDGSKQLTLFPTDETDFVNSKDNIGWIDEMLFVFQRPIIVMPAYEKMAMPENIKSRITLERLILAMKKEQRATDTECMWYLSTVSLAEPISGVWFRIYQKLFRDWYLEKGVELPDFIKEPIQLSEYDKGQLSKLAFWIYSIGMKELKLKHKNK